MTVSSRNAAITARPLTAFKGKVTISSGERLGMTVCDVVRDLLALWDIYELKSTTPAFVIDRAVNDVNASLQMVWNHADERNYWSSDTLTVTLGQTSPVAENETTSASEIDLPADIQNVVGPCRLTSTSRPLVPLGTIGEIETFSDLYLDGETCTEPLAYHINRFSQSGADPAKCVFMVTPAVAVETSFNLEVVRNAPRFTADDMTACPLIPIPHRYVESLLLPIARYHASSFSMFRGKELKESIDRDYQTARVALGFADPLPGKAGDNIDRRDVKKS